MRNRGVKFVDASRKFKKSVYIRYKNRIRLGEDSNLFYTPLVLDYNPDSQWFDFFFLSKKFKRVVWNATIHTPSLIFHEKVWELAYDHASSLLPHDKRHADDNLLSSMVPVTIDGEKMYEYVPRNFTYPELDNKTFSQFVSDYEQVVIDTNPPTIHEYVKIDRSYRWGIGLHFLVDVDAINKEVIEDTIVKFWESGEVSWTNPTPVSADRLPKLSQRTLQDQALKRLE